MSKFNLYKVNIFVFFILYISLILGFVFNENLNYGSYIDWVGAYVNPIKDFSENFSYTILNYDQYGNRHSPAYLIILSSILKDPPFWYCLALRAPRPALPTFP